MKLKIQFGDKTRFDAHNLPIIQARVRLVPTRRISLRTLALAEPPQPTKYRVD